MRLYTLLGGAPMIRSQMASRATLMFCAEPSTCTCVPATTTRVRVAFSIACRVLPSAPAMRPTALDRWSPLKIFTSFTSNESTNRSSNPHKASASATSKPSAKAATKSAPFCTAPASGVVGAAPQFNTSRSRIEAHLQLELFYQRRHDLRPGLAQRRVAVRRDAHLAVLDAPLRGGVERRELGHRRLVRFFCSRLAAHGVASLDRARRVRGFAFRGHIWLCYARHSAACAPSMSRLQSPGCTVPLLFIEATGQSACAAAINYNSKRCCGYSITISIAYARRAAIIASWAVDTASCLM